MTETDTVATFIKARQDRVLERALATLGTADDADLVADSHRLAGTLGTFDLPEAAAVMRDLEVTASTFDVTPEQLAQARAAAVQRLTAVVTARKESGS